MDPNPVLLEALFFAIAALYSVTGHGGGTGYILAMALLGMAPEEIKPLALALNLVVAGAGTLQFYRAGHFHRGLFLPFIITSAPLAMLGGYLRLPGHMFNILLGATLVVAALRMAVRPVATAGARPPLAVAMAAGAAIGLMSGLVGVGGGIFLTPLLLLAGWANPRQAAAVSAPFIFLNSLFGLIGYSASVDTLMLDDFPWLAVAVLAGGMLGAYIGSSKLPMPAITRVLSMVLLAGGIKLLYFP